MTFDDFSGEDHAFALSYNPYEATNNYVSKHWKFSDIDNSLGSERLRLNLMIAKVEDKDTILLYGGVIMLGMAFVIALVKCGLRNRKVAPA